MADTILFEELDEAPDLEVLVEAAIELAVSAFVGAPTTGLFAYGELHLSLEAPAYSLEPPAILIGYGEIPVEAGYSFIPTVVPVSVDAFIPISCFATTEPLFVRGVIPITCSATSVTMIPVDDSPFVEVDDWFFLADSPNGEEVLDVTARLLGTTGASVMARRLINATESMKLRDQLRLLLEAVVADTAVFADVLAGNPIVTTALVDSLVLAGVVDGSVAAMALVSDLAALVSAVASIQEAEANDAAALAETLEALARALEVVVSTAVFSEAVQGLAVLTVLVPEALAITDPLDASALRYAVIEDELAIAMSFDFDGVPYVGISMNAATKGITEYDAFDYNSLASYNGKLYGAGAAGLYRLQGATDAGAPIAAYLRTAMNLIADGKAARISDAYLGFRASGGLQLKVIVPVKDPKTKQTRKVAYVYDLRQAPTGAPQPGLFDVGRGIKSVYVAYELGNVAGSDFAIDVLKIRPLVTDRRLP